LGLGLGKRGFVWGRVWVSDEKGLIQFLYLHTPTALECAALTRDVHLLTLEVTMQRVECPAATGRLGMLEEGPTK